MLPHALHALGHLEPSGTLQQTPALVPSEPQTPWPTKPHIVLWLVDDQGWSNVGYHNERAITPTMDALAAEGAALDRHYTAPWRSRLVDMAPSRLVRYSFGPGSHKVAGGSLPVHSPDLLSFSRLPLTPKT